VALAIVVAVGRGGVIGSGGRMPWHLPEDLRRFRELTLGHTVVMGRKTFESIGRPLDGRRNIVLTRQQGGHHEGVEAARSLDEALAMADGDVFVIGGGEVYREALPLADTIYLTRVEGDYAGDTFFPPIDPEVWSEVSREAYKGFDFCVFTRKRVLARSD
jgi:dihydrofolate reductase